MRHIDNPFTLKLLAGFAASALLFSACSSSGSDNAGSAADSASDGTTEGAEGSAEDAALVDEITADLTADADSPFADDAEADCAANGIVDGIGTERLAELKAASSATGGLDTLDLTADEIDTVVATFGECTDMVAFMTTQLATQFGDETATCMMDKLGQDFVDEAMAAGLEGVDPTADSAFLESMITATSSCGVN